MSEEIMEVTNNETNDPYAYLERNDFTSEKYKIQVKGLPKIYGIKEFKKLINEKLGLSSGKVKPAKRGSPWAFVCFRSQEAQDHAISIINGTTWKNNKLTAKVIIIIITLLYLISSTYLYLFIYFTES